MALAVRLPTNWGKSGTESHNPRAQATGDRQVEGKKARADARVGTAAAQRQPLQTESLPVNGPRPGRQLSLNLCLPAKPVFPFAPVPRSSPTCRAGTVDVPPYAPGRKRFPFAPVPSAWPWPCGFRRIGGKSGTETHSPAATGTVDREKEGKKARAEGSTIAAAQRQPPGLPNHSPSTARFLEAANYLAYLHESG